MDSRTALSELQNFQKSRKGAGDYYTQYQDELGVGNAQQSANDVRSLIRNTENSLRGVNASVAGRTRGFNVNEAQRARLENLERAPISQELGTLQGRYGDEMQNYRDLLGQATTRAGQSYQTDADRMAALEGNYNKLFQSELAAAEEARWRQQFEESNRQFREQMSAADRRAAETKAMMASITARPPAAPVVAPSASTYRAGNVLSRGGNDIAYDVFDQNGRNIKTQLTDAGKKFQEQQNWTDSLMGSSNPLAKIYGNYRNWIGGWLGY